MKNSNSIYQTVFVLILTLAFVGCASSNTFIGPGGAQTMNQFKQPFNDFYFKSSFDNDYSVGSG